MARGRPKTGTTNGNGDGNRKNSSAQTTLDPNANGHLVISTLETWLWDAACAIRGATDAPKFKGFILPLIFYKRLSDVFDDEFATTAMREVTRLKVLSFSITFRNIN